MQWIRSLPWWTRSAAAAGMGLVSMCAGVVSERLQWAGLIAGLILVGLAIIGVVAHYPKWPVGFVSTEDAGRWLYANVPERMRQGMRDSTLSSIEEAGRSFVIHATGPNKACTLFARRESGLPLEEIDPMSVDFTAFEAAFGTDRKLPIETFVRRRDLRRILTYYLKNGG